MIPQLNQLVTETLPSVFTQVLKSKKHQLLYNWVMAETADLDNISVKGRVIYLLQGKPELKCKYGNLRKLKQNNKEFGHCGNISSCQCFRDNMSEYAKSNDIQNLIKKRKATWLEKYGVDNVSKSPLIQEKRAKTFTENDHKQLFEKLSYEKETIGFSQVIDRVKDYVIPLFSRDDYNGCFRKNFYRWQCVKCKHEFDDHVDYGRVPRCKKCFPKFISAGELELRQIFRDSKVDFIENDTSVLGGLELDIYIPSLHIAFEFNGVYWHSSKFKTADYHVSKYLKAKNQGVHLVQIFEDEWKNKSEIIKSRIANLLGGNKRIYARKCSIDTVTPLQYKEFTEKTHLQGYAPASFVYGLTYQSQLVAIMSFGRSRYTNDEYELIRYCSVGNVVGGASKLFAKFIKDHAPNSVVSYANRCWSNGELYRQLGFTDITSDEKNIGYFYLKNDKRYHRSSFTKKRLVEMGYDTNQTESEIMDENGYMKIYDCGNYKFLWGPKL